MPRVSNSFLWATRAMAAIGFFALTLSEDITPSWGLAAWVCWGVGILLDRVPKTQQGIRRAETVAVIGLVSFILVDFFALHQTLFIVVAHFLLLFAMFKCLGPKERRDGMQMGVISFFEVLAACTLSADVWQAVLLVALIPAGTALLYWNQVERIRALSTGTAWPDHPLKQLHKTIAVGAVPFTLTMTLAVFVLFPRMTFNVQIPGFNAGRSSYTDGVNLERQGSITEDNSVAVWVAFADPEQRARWGGYLRGDVLDNFDGKQWSVTANRPATQRYANANSAYPVEATPLGVTAIRVTVTLLNTSKNTLFMPGVPLTILAPLNALIQSNADTWSWSATQNRPLKYDVYIVPGPWVREEVLSPETIATDRHLPALPIARIEALAAQVAGSGPLLDQARRIQEHLRTNYRYSLNFGPATENPVENFLFTRKQGACGHFASAMALMLRLQGIPSRVIAGYHGGDWNEPAQQLFIREKHAHAWVEAYIDGAWRSFDPTPLPSELEGPQRSSIKRLWLRAQQYWDFAGYLWNRFIIEYDMQTQWKGLLKLKEKSDGAHFKFLERWTNPVARTPESRRTAKDSQSSVPPLLIFFLSALALGGIFYWLLHRNPHTVNPVPADYLKFLSRMERAGLPRQPWETAIEFAARAQAKFPDQAGPIEMVTASYMRARFSTSSMLKRRF